MAIKDLPKYKDIRNTIRRNGRYPVSKVGNKVGIEAKDTHVVHQSMTKRSAPGSNPDAFANTHIDKNGWQGIAYAFVIMPDGTIFQCDDLDRRTNHAGNTNDRSIGTCLVGDFRKDGAAEVPTEEQKESLYLLNKELYKELPNMKQTLGHQECPGYSWKNCPGDTWNYKEVIAEKKVPDAALSQTNRKEVGEMPLKAGDKGEAVKVLNHQLASLGYISWKDREYDTFGTTTLNALKKFQKDQHLKETGVYDYKTARQFAKVLAVYHEHWVQTKE